MRNWEARPLHAEPDFALKPTTPRPELVLTPVQALLSTRDDSPVRRCPRQVHPVADVVPDYTIPMDNIMIVDVATPRSKSHLIMITTLSMGYFEFDCITRNGHDILLAFLTASVAPERLMHHDEGSTVKSTSSVTSCLDLDVDAMTAQHMRGRAERETWPEKFSRRFGRVANTLQEISGSICDMTCCQHSTVDSETRDRPPYSTTTNALGEMEMDENDSTMPSPERDPAAKDYYYRRRVNDRNWMQKYESYPAIRETEPEIYSR
jgi:hypothetical protein